MNLSQERANLSSIEVLMFTLVGIALEIIGWTMNGVFGVVVLLIGVAVLFVCLALRSFLILHFFEVGMILTIDGWTMTGELKGLGMMMLGMVFLLTALFVYNKPYGK